MSELSTPFMFDFYTHYYDAVTTSSANAEYCERVYGRNLCQHGFAGMDDLDDLTRVSGISKNTRVFDLGCGNGMISEYISDKTGAHVTGIDFVEKAIKDAVTRTHSKRGRLDFRVMDMNYLVFPSGSFDILISIDTLFFTDIYNTLKDCLPLLKDDGKMVIFFDQSCGPETPLESYPVEITQVDKTDLAQALQKLNLSYRYWDFSDRMLEHLRNRSPVLEDLKNRFITEGNLFLYDNHIGEANGIEHAYTHNAGKRYLYLAYKDQNKKIEPWLVDQLLTPSEIE